MKTLLKIVLGLLIAVVGAAVGLKCGNAWGEWINQQRPNDPGDVRLGNVLGGSFWGAVLGLLLGIVIAIVALRRRS